MKNQLILAVSTIATTLFANQLPDMISNLNHTENQSVSQVVQQEEVEQQNIVAQNTEEIAKKVAEEAVKQAAEEESAKQAAEEESAKQAAAQEAAKQAAAQEAAKQAVEEEADKQAAAQQAAQQAATQQSTQPSRIKISAARAKEIALAQVSGTIVEFSQDFDEYIPKYEITIRNGNVEYEFDISAVDGSILSREVDYDDYDYDDRYDDDRYDDDRYDD